MDRAVPNYQIPSTSKYSVEDASGLMGRLREMKEGMVTKARPGERGEEKTVTDRDREIEK